MRDATEFEELRPMLFAIAYRILGSVVEAEDAVQETWVRWQETPTEPRSTRAFLTTVVTRIAIDVLRSARSRRESYVGPWFPEPLTTDPYDDPERSAELADSVSAAALVLLERLSPVERAVFVLRDVFGFGYAEIAATVQRTEGACRQMASRARRHVREGRPRFDVDRAAADELADRFLDAVRAGDVEGLREVLAADAVLLADAGGKAPSWQGRGTLAGEKLVRLLVSVAPSFDTVGVVVERTTLNGQPGMILRDAHGGTMATWTLDVGDGRIQTIRATLNPDKLQHLGAVADTWAVYARARQERRQPGGGSAGPAPAGSGPSGAGAEGAESEGAGAEGAERPPHS